MNSEIFVEIDDKIEFDVDFDNNKIDGITKIEISPNGKYLITYNKKDSSIVGWNVDDVVEGQLKPENYRHFVHNYCNVDIRVSNDKKLAYIFDNTITIIDMGNGQEIELEFKKLFISCHHHAFSIKGEFILCSDVKNKYGADQKVIWIYSTKTKNNKWMCKKIYKLPKDFELVSISKYDQLYLFSNNYIYVWNTFTGESIKIFIEEKVNKAEAKKHIRISSSEKFICLRIKDKITIYSIELEIPIATLNDGVQLYNFINNVDYIYLYLLLLPLLSSGILNLTMKYCWKEYLNRLQKNGQYYDQLQKVIQSKNTPFPPFLFDIRCALGILNGYVWKFKLEEMILKMNYSLDEPNNEIIGGLHYNEHDDAKQISKETYEHLNIHLYNPLDAIREFFQEVISYYDQTNADKGIKNLEKMKDSIRWKIETSADDKVKLLQVSKKTNVSNVWKQICTRTDIFMRLYGNKPLNGNSILLLTNIDDINVEDNKHRRKSIKILRYYKKLFSKSTLPLPNYNSFKLSNEWVSYIENNKSVFLKYGVELLSFAIKEHKLESIDKIYRQCIDYFKEDLNNNRMFLSIISSTLPLFNEYYPEYISKYTLETIMIIDSSAYTKEYQNKNPHLCSLPCLQIVNYTRSILWTKHNILIDKNTIIYWILFVIQPLLMLLALPISPSFFVLLKYHIINDFSFNNKLFIYFYFFYIFDIISKYIPTPTSPTTPTITLMNPYIKFVKYPQEYNWFWELIKPQSSPFVKAISGDIYKTWNGEALINFKWNTYGKYYYTIIWILFMALLGCFTSAATIPQQYISNNTQKQLLISSIILGFIHLSFEVRQIIYNPIKWIRNLWNIFDITAYFLSIYTSIYWLQTNDRNVWLLSFSCLFLDIKFLLFFRVFESFGVYFAIIISVGKQIISFLVVLLIIIISFAHAFFILLSPEPGFSFEERTNNNDPNDPWNLAPTYSKVLDDGTIDSKPYIIQQPDEHTNMFADYKTALFAMYLFLTGDSSALSNWSYLRNPPLAILIFLFSLLIVVYLMNLFIGLLNMAIEKDNNRVSYLIEKAEILAEIELFYLLPHQRRWNAWFPEVIYYYADVDKTREEVNKLINDGKWDTNEFPEMKKDLFKKLNIKNNLSDEIDLKMLLEKIENVEKSCNTLLYK